MCFYSSSAYSADPRHRSANETRRKESQRARRRQLEDINNKSVAHQDTLEREAQEEDEMQQAIRHLESQRQQHQEYRDDLKAQIADIQQEIKVRRTAQQQHQRQLDNQARHNTPELHFWESHLAMRISGSENLDRLTFTYTHVDPRDWDRECSFDLDMSAGNYDVPSTEPRLENEDVDRVLEALIETRDLAVFLKSMRSLFVEAVGA